jgi:hypothetical protein
MQSVSKTNFLLEHSKKRNSRTGRLVEEFKPSTAYRASQPPAQPPPEHGQEIESQDNCAHDQ